MLTMAADVQVVSQPVGAACREHGWMTQNQHTFMAAFHLLLPLSSLLFLAHSVIFRFYSITPHTRTHTHTHAPSRVKLSV